MSIKFWHTVAERHLPGALTLVLPASAQVPEALFGILPATEPRTVGIRVLTVRSPKAF